MKWLKRALQRWLEIAPVSRTFVTYNYAKGLNGKPVEMATRHWPDVARSGR
jgi:hypothetical protein